MRNVFITNGYITAEALRGIAPLLDAVNIDLKFFRDELYRKVCGARLQPVLDAIRMFHELGVWIEITTLLIPGYNDDMAQIRQTAEFIANFHCEIPWHITAFYPMYTTTEVAATPPATLRKARKAGKSSGLKHIYPCNVGEQSDTLCSECGTTLIERSITGVDATHIKNARCPECGYALAGVWT